MEDFLHRISIPSNAWHYLHRRFHDPLCHDRWNICHHLLSSYQPVQLRWLVPSSHSSRGWRVSNTARLAVSGTEAAAALPAATHSTRQPVLDGISDGTSQPSPSKRNRTGCMSVVLKVPGKWVFWTINVVRQKGNNLKIALTQMHLDIIYIEDFSILFVILMEYLPSLFVLICQWLWKFLVNEFFNHQGCN